MAIEPGAGLAGIVAGHIEGNDFSVRPAGFQVRALSDHDAALAHNNSADERIGSRGAATSLGQQQRTGHPVRVG